MHVAEIEGEIKRPKDKTAVLKVFVVYQENINCRQCSVCQEKLTSSFFVFWACSCACAARKVTSCSEAVLLEETISFWQKSTAIPQLEVVAETVIYKIWLAKLVT